jgi:Domain of unknown function DUF83.
MSNPQGAKMQLLFYMWQLKTSLNLKVINGKVVSGRTTHFFIEGNEANMKMMEELIEEISQFLEQPTPPPFEHINLWKGQEYKKYCL